MTVPDTLDASDASDASHVPDEATRATRRWLRAWPYVVVIVVALSGSALHAARYTELSPFDESRHVDYIAQLYERGHVVRLGDKIGETAMRLEACRGIDLPGYVPPPCNAKRLDSVDFRDEGFNNSVNNPPLYYVVTGAVAEVVKATGLSGNILDPARVMGGVWLALGLALAVYAGELLGVRRVPLVAAGVIFALAPDPLFMAGTVNADSASVFGGALVLVAALLWERRRLRIGWMFAAGAIAGSLKMTNLIGVGIVGAWVLTQAYRAHRNETAAASPDVPSDEAPPDDQADPASRTTREYLWAAGLLVAGAVAVTVLWLGIAGARATVDSLALPSNQVFYTPSFPFKTFLLRQNVFSLFPPIGGIRPPVLITLVSDTVTGAIELLAVAVMVTAVLRFDVRDRLSALGVWAGVVLLAAGPGFILSTWLVNKVVFQPLSRYGLSSLAVLIVITAGAARGRVGTVALSLFAVLVACTVLGTLAFG